MMNKTLRFIMLMSIIINVKSAIAQDSLTYRFRQETGRVYDNSFTTDGNFLYATKYDGGESGNGYIYRMDLDGGNFTILHHFANVEAGAFPVGRLLLVDSVFFGMTQMGGITGEGVIFSIRKDGTNFRKIMEFEPNKGSPISSLSYTEGKLFGMASEIIFSVNTDGTNMTTLHTFSGMDGGNPSGHLEVVNSTLFGTALRGGTSDGGVVFKISTRGERFSVIHEFTMETGAAPRSGVIHSNGKLYGTLSFGDVVFCIDTLGNRSRYISINDDWSINFEGLALKDSTLYGFAFTHKVGVFKVDTALTKITAVAWLPNWNFFPSGVPLLINDELFGPAFGGAYNYGGLFSLKIDGSSITRLKDFTGSNLGFRPSGSVIELGDYFYGLTQSGGMQNKGVLYKVRANGSNYKVLHHFKEPTGSNPVASLVVVDTMLYGMTSFGGAHQSGVLFRIGANGFVYEKLHDFSYEEGNHPRGTLVKKDSLLFGFASSGGPLNDGTIFKYDIIKGTYTTIFNFGQVPEHRPMGGLQYADSTLYGLVLDEAGAANVVFSIAPNGTGYKRIFTDSPEIAGRYQGTTLVADTVIYVISESGGTTDNGILYRINTDGKNYKKLVDFNYSIGAYPQHALALAADTLYGITRLAGPTGFGGIFKVAVGSQELRYLMAASTSGRLQSLTHPTSTEGSLAVNGDLLVAVISQLQQNATVDEKIITFKINTVDVREEQEIVFSEPETKTYGAPPFDLIASSESGLPITFTSGNQDILTIQGNIATIHGAGNTTITAVQSGNHQYQAAPPVTKALTVNKANQTITFDEIPAQSLGQLTLLATSSSGLPVTFQSLTPTVTVTSNSPTAVTAGLGRIIAEQSGNQNYNSAIAVEREFCITPNAPLINVVPIDEHSTFLISSVAHGNQWFRDGVLMPDMSNDSIVVSNDASYSASVVVEGCSGALSTAVSFVITRIEESSVFLIMPNPVHDFVTIYSSQSFSPSLEVIDAMGRSHLMIAERYEDSMRLDLSSLRAGIYLLRMTSSTRTRTLRIAKD